MSSAEAKGIDPSSNSELKILIRKAKEDFVPLNYIKRVLMLVENGVSADEFNFDRFDTDFRSEAYATVGGQNSNNSVRITNKFLQAVEEAANWELINRTDGSVAESIPAKKLWDMVATSAWQSADPGVQFHDTINEWHTCLDDGEIIASNPCSEYMFLDDTACNLASLNLVQFYDEEKKSFMLEEYVHATRLWTIVLEISVLMAQLPSEVIAKRTYEYRTLGLGYANLGALLMKQGIPYESERGYAMTGALTAILTGESYATSAEMAKTVGAFARYAANQDTMLKVIRNHRRAAYSAPKHSYENLTVYPMGINSKYVEPVLLEGAQRAWDYALALGKEFGYRNAQATCIAPTGTIGLVMDCDTTGIEPDFAVVKFKKLVGGGYFKLVNQSVQPALENLEYSEGQIREIIDYIVGTQKLEGAPHINIVSLTNLGFTRKEIAAVEATLPGMFELKYAFSKWTLGEDFCKSVIQLSQDQMNDPNLDMLEILGFSKQQIEEAEEVICGRMTIEGAPHVKQEHYSIFDCASKCGKKGTRFISPIGHIKQMAAAQPFISGAISKTINLPEEATISDVQETYYQSWKSMIKANALYRDGSKLSQPLSTSSADNAYAALFSFDEEDSVDETVDAKKIQEVTVRQQQPVRRKLPAERHSLTHKFSVAGTEGYITVGLYEDGNPGEVFITMQKAGSTLNGIMDAFAVSLSLNLQYGVPLEILIRKYVHSRFEPSGMTENTEIPMAKSVLDYIARWMALRFLDVETAKYYHNPELVDKSYDSGTNSRILIPFINGKGHTEVTEQAGSMVSAGSINIEKVTLSANTSALDNTLHMEDEGLSLEQLQKNQQNLAATSTDGDAPLCTNCGSVTTRQGSCYYCTSCGETTGCS
jgi:ribonucleoside-diphosphate reductase alpha chain